MKENFICKINYKNYSYSKYKEREKVGIDILKFITPPKQEYIYKM